MNLIVDIGNTSVKLAVFEELELLEVASAPFENWKEEQKKLVSKHPEITHAIISSVTGLEEEDVEFMSGQFPLHQLSYRSKLPFDNQYASPETLGADRLALAAAAVLHYQEGNILVIDAGTCITYDMVSKRAYLGGAISPGLQMRYTAMHDYTARLPLLKPEAIEQFIGQNTENSMHSGVVNGLCREIEGVVAQYENRFPHLTVILTGGDSQFLSNRLKKAIFAHSNFLLEGLNYLLEQNKH